MSPHAPVQLVVMASSLGGLKALSCVLGALDESFPVPIALVQHQQARASSSLLTGVLKRQTAMRVALATTGMSLDAGCVYVAPPDRHFTLRDDRTVLLADGPRVSGLRSAADPLFKSSAELFGQHLVGVVLTGTERDGAAGATAIHQHGGRVMVQNPDDAESPGMPQSTLSRTGADWVLMLDEIGPMLRSLTA